MCDKVDFHEPGDKNRYSDLDTDETDCYSSACEDDESIGTSDDEGSSDVVSGTNGPIPGDCCKLSDVEISEYHSSPIPGDNVVRFPDVDGPEGSTVEYTEDGFKGFDYSEIKDKRALLLFKKFREIDCLCDDQIKEEEGGVRQDSIQSPQGQLDQEEIKDEEGEVKDDVITSPQHQQDHEINEEAQESRDNTCRTAPPVRKAKKKAECFLQELKEVFGQEEQDINNDDQDYDAGDSHDDKQRNSVGKEIDIENHRRGVWSCDQCNFRTNHKRVINQHQWSHKLGQDCFKCSLCSLKFKDATRLSYHVQNDHEDPVKTAIQPFQSSCSICNLEFENSRSLHSHVKKEHPESQKNNFYKCALCNHSTQNKSTHRNHMMKHKENSYVCEHCDYSTSNGASYRTHMMKHSGERPYSCPHCPYRARQRPHLKQHLLFHMDLKPYECNVCHFKTRQKSHLTKHLLWVHSNDKPFKCSLCEFTAKSKQTRDTHYRSQHTNDKPHACKICPFKSAHSNVLNDHKKGHGANLDYPCPECTWSARTSLSQSYHVSRCHPDSKWIKKCQECDFTTMDLTSLRNHLKNKHGVSLNENALGWQINTC